MILVFLANGTEEVEAITPVDIIKRAEKEVLTIAVGTDKEKIVTGSHGIKISCDETENNLKMFLNKNLEMIIIPGGMPGTLNLEKSQNVQYAIDYCVNNNIFIGAICAAPSILGHKGLLKNKTATCFPGFEEQLFGANITKDVIAKDEI
ncbi:MAG: DJ-1/PfpI family protein, partial [Oscillospiraceae bacterium]